MALCWHCAVRFLWLLFHCGNYFPFLKILISMRGQRWRFRRTKRWGSESVPSLPTAGYPVAGFPASFPSLYLHFFPNCVINLLAEMVSGFLFCSVWAREEPAVFLSRNYHPSLPCPGAVHLLRSALALTRNLPNLLQKCLGKWPGFSGYFFSH